MHCPWFAARPGESNTVPHAHGRPQLADSSLGFPLSINHSRLERVHLPAAEHIAKSRNALRQIFADKRRPREAHMNCEMMAEAMRRCIMSAGENPRHSESQAPSVPRCICSRSLQRSRCPKTSTALSMHRHILRGRLLESLPFWTPSGYPRGKHQNRSWSRQELAGCRPSAGQVRCLPLTSRS